MQNVQRVLITGGAGFIGSHLADELLEHGYRVRVLDSLDPQIHGALQGRPVYLHPDVELLVGDVRSQDDIARALKGIDAVFHFAAAVGVGQSMYEIDRYTSINNQGTAELLQALSRRPVQRLVVASSMSIYGEGLYKDSHGKIVSAIPRSAEAMRSGNWEACGADGSALTPIATDESKIAEPSSVYALSKWDQERLCLIVGGAYRMPTVALRFFNVYGPRQSLSNPYTGVLAIFASRFLNRKPPRIFEDGLQRRDFVHVRDVARACRLALQSPEAAGEVINIGSGVSCTVREIAELMAEAMDLDHIEPDITHQYRKGDIRHCFADITKARRLLQFQPSISLREGIEQLIDWLVGQGADDYTDRAHSELLERGLAL